MRREELGVFAMSLQILALCNVSKNVAGLRINF